MDTESRIFVDIVLDSIIFFCTCTEEECNPDVAVEALESIAGSLNRLGTAEDRRVLLVRAHERIESETRPRAKQTLATLHDILGFGDN